MKHASTVYEKHEQVLTNTKVLRRFSSLGDKKNRIRGFGIGLGLDKNFFWKLSVIFLSRLIKFLEYVYGAVVNNDAESKYMLP